MNVQTYTLANGMKLWVHVNKDEPRIYTQITVNAGSKNDPIQKSGLAHYLEHLMFKGTSKIGALDWEKESVLLNKIENLYEDYNKTDNLEEKLLSTNLLMPYHLRNQNYMQLEILID
ncbi:MAG: insulinase family protein [Saprospiraceae bacterium]|nr:insulinase family protein [Saprospiraceae bacterium]